MTEAPETRLPIGSDLHLLCEAARAVITGRWRTGRPVRTISASALQRHIRVGFAKAQRLMLLLEQEGVIETRFSKPGWQWRCLVPPDGLDAALERIRQSAGVRACRHCHAEIVPCSCAVKAVCNGWKHTEWLVSMPVGAHYCDGRSVNPPAEPAPETAKEDGDDG